MSGDNTTARKRPRTIAAPLGQASKAGDKPEETRLTVLTDHTGEVNSFLIHEDRQHGSYNIPLGRVKTYAKDEAPYGENVLVPLIPALDPSAPGDEQNHGSLSQRAREIERGYVYLWLDGHLWREFKAQGGGDLREVNLEHYAGQDERPATGVTEHRITVPYKVQGQRREIQIAYSPVQWSWRRIERLGGMDYAGDPRVQGRNNRHALNPLTGEPGRPIPKDGFEGNQHAAEVRGQRLDRVDVSGHEQAPKFGDTIEPDLKTRRAGVVRLDQTNYRHLTVGSAYKKGALPVVVVNSHMAKAYQAREDHAQAVNAREDYYDCYRDGDVAPDGTKESFLSQTRGGERNVEAYELAKITREHFYFRPDQGMALLELQNDKPSRPAHWKGGGALGRSQDEVAEEKRLERLRERETRRIEYRNDNTDHDAFRRYLGRGSLRNPVKALIEDILAARKRLVACIDHEAFFDELADYTDRPAPGCLLAHHCQGELLDGVIEHPAGDDGRTFLDFKDYDDYQQRNYDTVSPLLDKLRESDYAAYFFPAGSPDDIQPNDGACERDCQLPFPDRAIRDWLEWAKQNPTQANKKLDALLDHHLADNPAAATVDHEPAWKDFEVQRRLALLAQKLTNVVAGSDKLLPGLKTLYEKQQEAKNTTETKTAERAKAKTDSHKLKQDVASERAKLKEINSQIADIENDIERTRDRQTWARLEAGEAAKRLDGARERLRNGYTELAETGNKAAVVRDQRLALETRLRGAESARALATKSASDALETFEKAARRAQVTAGDSAALHRQIGQAQAETTRSTASLGTLEASLQRERAQFVSAGRVRDAANQDLQLAERQQKNLEGALRQLDRNTRDVEGRLVRLREERRELRRYLAQARTALENNKKAKPTSSQGKRNPVMQLVLERRADRPMALQVLLMDGLLDVVPDTGGPRGVITATHVALDAPHALARAERLHAAIASVTQQGNERTASVFARGQAYDLPLGKALGNSQALHQLVAALEGREQLLDGAIGDLRRDLTGRIAMRRQAVAFTERQNEQSRAASERLQAAQKKADAAAQEQVRLRERTETLKTERGALQADLEAKRVKLRQAMAHWHTAQADYQQLVDNGELQTTDTRVAQTKNEVLRLEEQLLAADNDLAQTRRRHSQALEAMRRTQTQAEAAHRELADRQQRITEEARKKRKLDNAHKETSQRQRQAKNESDASEARLRENDRRIADAQSRLDEAQRQLDWVNEQRDLSKRQWAMLNSHGGLTSLFTVYEWWNLKKAIWDDDDTSKSWHALLRLLDTTLSTAAATLETAGVGARGLYHGRLVSLEKARRVERTGERWVRAAASITMILGVVDAYRAYEDHNPELAWLETLNVAGGGLLWLGTIEAISAKTVLGLGAGTLLGLGAALSFVVYAVCRRYVVEDDTDKWLRHGPWGVERFEVEPYSGWGEDYAQFRHQWVGLTTTPKASLDVEEDKPQHQARRVVVNIDTVPSEALQGDLEVQLEVRPFLPQKVFHTEAIPAWLKHWQSVTLLGANDREPPSLDKGLGRLALHEALVGVLRDPAIELKPDGSGYRLIVDTNRFAALEAAYRDELKLYIGDPSGGFKSAYQATVELRVRLRRRVNAGGAYTLPVPGSPQDSSQGDGYVTAQTLVR